MAVHEVRLLRHETVAEGTMAFHLSRPPGFTYRAGQNILLSLIDPPETDQEGDKRTFTLASAPYEDDLMVATRMRDTAFKRVLGRLPSGAALRFDGPNGDLFLSNEDADARPAVLLAGGIGITPFRSMVLQAARENFARPVLLVYGSRRPEDAAFLGELQSVADAHENFRLVAVMSDPQASGQPWTGETGRIDRALIERLVAEPNAAQYYFAGPPPMTRALEILLEELGVAEEAMHHDDFYGY